MDKILWKYLEMLPEQEAAFYEWNKNLSGWHCFNTFYIYYLKVEGEHTKFMECTAPCNYGCPRVIAEDTPNNIVAVCPQGKAAPIKLKFKDILIYSLRHEDFHKALCVSLQIKQPSIQLSECKKACYLGEHSGTAVYLTYHIVPVMLTETISSLCLLLRQSPFILLVPTRRGMTIEAQQMLEQNDAILLSLADELTLQSDGSFKVAHSISECMMNPVITAMQ